MKSEVKCLKLCKSKLGHRKHFRKFFWSHLKFKNGSELKITYSRFLRIFRWQSWNCLLEKQSIQNCLNQDLVIWSNLENKTIKNECSEPFRNPNLIIRSISENGFEALLWWKTNVLNFWNWHFPVFCKFLNDEVETVFWESETVLRKIFVYSLIFWELFRKCFSAYIWSL